MHDTELDLTSFVSDAFVQGLFELLENGYRLVDTIRLFCHGCDPAANVDRRALDVGDSSMRDPSPFRG